MRMQHKRWSNHANTDGNRITYRDYKVLYNRINKQKDAINDEMVKQEALEIFHEIDRKEDM